MAGMLQIITYLLAFYLVMKGVEILQIGWKRDSYFFLFQGTGKCQAGASYVPGTSDPWRRVRVNSCHSFFNCSIGVCL
jgi:hypothetical protein